MKKVRKWPYVVLVVGSLAVSTLLSIIAPKTNTANQPHFSQLVTILLTITIIIPYLAAWIFGAMSWYSFSQLVYDGAKKNWAYTKAFRFIATGVGLLVADLIGFSLFGSVRNLLIHHYMAAMYLTIASNLFHVIVPLLAFVSMYRGTREMLRQSHYAEGFGNKLSPVLLPTAIFVGFFAVMAYTNVVRQFPSTPDQLATYYLSDSWLLGLVIVPLALTWALSLRVMMDTERFVHSLPHNLRGNLDKFFYGLVAVISSSIIVQALTALGNQRLQDIGLTALLLVIYLFLLLQTAAYWLIYRGAQELRHSVKEVRS